MYLKKELTVIIPYYKKLRYFKKTYQSLINQTNSNFYVIIIYDDDDKAELKEIQKIVKSKNFKYIINKKNIGVAASRNKGIASIKTKYVAFLDADDYWKKTKVDYQLKLMKKKKLQFTHTSYEIIDDHNNLKRIVSAKKFLTYNELLKSCDIGLSTVMIERKILKNLKFGRTKTKEDYILWLKIAKKKIKIFGINKTLSYWRKSKGSLSNNIFQKLTDAFRVYSKYEKFSLIFSYIFTLRLSLNFLMKYFLQTNKRI